MMAPAELVLAQIWNAQWLRDELETTDGRRLRVVYRGVWTHGLGPDFSGAYLDLGGEVLQGDVEIHVRSSDWLAHGHQLDPAYNRIILHVVYDDDLPARPRRQDGGTVATMVLRSALPGPLEAFPADPNLRPLGAIGFAHCAPRVAAFAPERLHALWEEAGDRRMRDKVDVVAGRLEHEPPAQTLYALLLDALGFSRNRAGMAAVASRLPYDHLAARLEGYEPADRFLRASALLLGVGGFLPLSPREAEFAGLSPLQVETIEATWSRQGVAWHDARVGAGTWQTARVRPASHPLRRLLAMAMLLSRLEEGLIEDSCRMVAMANARDGLRWLTAGNPYLGRTHAHEIVVNVLVPFALAYGEATGQDQLLGRAGQLWYGLAAGQGNAVVRETVRQICGPTAVPVRSARAEQGLLHLRRTGCAVMRCFECPVAHLALRFDSATESAEG